MSRVRTPEDALKALFLQIWSCGDGVFFVAFMWVLRRNIRVFDSDYRSDVFLEKYLRKKEGRVLEGTRQSMKRKISNDL